MLVESTSTSFLSDINFPNWFPVETNTMTSLLNSWQICVRGSSGKEARETKIDNFRG